jgi:hypothetical protein
MYSGEEIHYWETMAEDLAKILCHPTRVAVLAEEGEKIFKIGGEQLAR